MEKATALYCRSARNDQEAIDKQIKELEQYCKEHNIESIKHYIDINQSGASPSRPELYLLMRDLEANKIDKVIVTSITRLSRDMTAKTLQAFIKNNGAELITLDHSEPDLDNNFFLT